MAHHGILTKRILDVVQHTANCPLDALVEQCPGFTWNQIFLEVDRMSRLGQLQLMDNRSGICLNIPSRKAGGKALTPETPVGDPEQRQRKERQRITGGNDL